MSADPRRKPVLFRLAAEGVVPVVGGCAGALAGGVEGGMAGVAVAKIVEKAIDLFGRGIVERWQAWFAQHSPEQQAEALSELVTLTPAEAREQARELLLELVPDASAADLDLALDYLSAIPGAVDRVLVTDAHTGKKTLPPTVTFDDPESLIRLLPVDLPPYSVPTDLADTPYRLEELLGAGGFGAVYRASAKTLQHLPLAIKFCLDRGLLASLQKERANLERLMKAANDRGAEHVVRLYGYDLDHATPYLVYEYVPGGDLTRHVRGQSLNADEVLDLIRQTAEGLAFAHRHGLVHRDVKPANVLVRDGVLKLADFGLGGVAVKRAVQRSRIGLSTIDYLSLAEQASLFRGAGTPLYMSPEQRRGANPDPRHDLYSLGVMWFQLLIGDVTRELHPGWAKELKVRYAAPQTQIELIERCVGWYEERPKDANELLALLANAGDELPDPGSLSPLEEFNQSPRRTEAVSAAAVGSTLEHVRREVRKETLDKRLDELINAANILDSVNREGPAQAAGVGALVWFFVFAFVWLLFSWPVALVVGLVLLILIVPSVRWVIRNQNAQLIRVREAAIETIRVEFPVEFAAWEGPDALRDLDLVTHIAESVHANPSFQVSEPPPAVEHSEPTPPPSIPATRMRWRWAIALALPLALAAGVFFAIRYEGYKKPFTDSVLAKRQNPQPFEPVYTNEIRWFHSDGTRTDSDGYNIAFRWTETLARVGGVGVGVAVFAGAVFGFRRRMIFPRSTVLAAMAGFVFPGLALGAGLYHQYYDSFKTSTVDQEGFLTRDAWGRPATEKILSELYHRQLVLHGYLLGAIPALLSAVGVMVFERQGMIRWAKRTSPRGTPVAEHEAPDEPIPVVAPTPPSDSSWLRSSLLVAKAKELADAYDAVFVANRQPVFPWVWGGLFLGLFVGWLTGEASHQLRYASEPFPAALRGTWDWYCVNWGLAVGVVVWFVVVLVGWVWRMLRRESAKVRVLAISGSLSREFLGHVAAWGGPTVLDTEDTALAICRAVARGDDPAVTPSRTLKQLDEDPEAKDRLTRQLNRYLRTKRDDESRIMHASGWFVGSWFFAPVLGFVVGMGVAGFFMLFPSTKHETPLVVAVSAPIGLGFAVTLGWCLWRRTVRVSEDVMRGRSALQVDLEREYGPAFRTLGGLDLNDTVSVTGMVMRFGTPDPSIEAESPPSLAAEIPPLDPMRQEVLIGRLKEHYKLLEARDEPPEIAPGLFTWIGPFVGLTIGGLLITAGMETKDIGGYFTAAFFLGGGTIGGSLWLGHYLGQKAREEREVRIRESRTSLERDYAAQLADWGGAELLRYKVAVGGMIRKLGGDPDW